jgi:hypothetical protein
MMERLKMSRVWAMPSADTFDIEPIHNFVWKYLHAAKVSIDPFARNKRWATYTNDINPNTTAEYHLDATDFLDTLAVNGTSADFLLFDPPYSARQLKECYESLGRKMQLEDGQLGRIKKEWRNHALPLLTNDAIVLSFGWNTVGFGKELGFELEEVMMVCHGGEHYDTICIAERRTQSGLFSPEFSDKEDK